MTYWVGSSLPSQQVMKSIALNFDTDKLGFCITAHMQTLNRHLTLCHTPHSHRA